MKICLFMFLAIILLSNLCYAVESMDIDISLSKNDIVTEIITLTIIGDESYDSVEFTTFMRPLIIIYEGEYSIREEDSNYVIRFEDYIVPGENIITFTLVYDQIIESSTKNKIFRTTFYPENAGQMGISLTLPLYHALSAQEPSATPKPALIETDGQRIKLYWEFQEQADIAVFYTGQREFGSQLIPAFIVIVLISFCIFIYFKKKTKKHISAVLSSEEIKVVEEVRKGVNKQKEIAKNLDFSKSKMSKVIRKLEEKGLIEKKPYFKTNIIKLSKKIK